MAAPARPGGGHRTRASVLPSSVCDATVGPYRLGRELGRGGFGCVFEGLHTRTGESVAIKRISLEKVPADELESVMSEIQLLKRLQHQNIVRYIDSIRTKEYLYIAMELVEKGSLLSMIKGFGVFTESLAAVYVAQVLRGLAYLHDQGVIHHDIKAANILTTKDGIVKLADFGVAAVTTDAGQAVDMGVVGSPFWMAPEVIEMSGSSSACDIWSLGSTVVELLAGVPPYFDLPPMSALFHIVQDETVPLPEGLTPTPALQDFLACCFRKDPTFRKTAVELQSHPWIVQNVLAEGEGGHSEPEEDWGEAPSRPPTAAIDARRKFAPEATKRPQLPARPGRDVSAAIMEVDLDLEDAEERDDALDGVGDDWDDLAAATKASTIKLMRGEHAGKGAGALALTASGALRTTAPPPLPPAAKKPLPGLPPPDDDDDDIGGKPPLSKPTSKTPAAVVKPAGLPASRVSQPVVPPAAPKTVSRPPAQPGAGLAAFADADDDEDFGALAPRGPAGSTAVTRTTPTAAAARTLKSGATLKVRDDDGEEGFGAALQNIRPDALKARLNALASGGPRPATPAEDLDWDADTHGGPGGAADAFAQFDAGDFRRDAAAEALKAGQRAMMALAERLRLDTATDVDGSAFASTCRRIVHMLRSTPALKAHFVKSHGVLPLVDVLASRSPVPNSLVVMSVLRILNALIDGNPDVGAGAPAGAAGPEPASAAAAKASLHDTLALIGVLPVVLQFAYPGHPTPVRAQAAAFIAATLRLEARGDASAITSSRTFVACGGIHALVGLLLPSSRTPILASYAPAHASDEVPVIISEADQDLPSDAPLARDEVLLWPGDRNDLVARRHEKLRAAGETERRGSTTTVASSAGASMRSDTRPTFSGSDTGPTATSALSLHAAAPPPLPPVGITAVATSAAAQRDALGATKTKDAIEPRAVQQIGTVTLRELAEHFVLREAFITRVGLEGIAAVFTLQTMTMATSEFRRLFVRAGVLEPLIAVVKAAYTYTCTQLTASGPAPPTDDDVLRGYAVSAPSTRGTATSDSSDARASYRRGSGDVTASGSAALPRLPGTATTPAMQQAGAAPRTHLPARTAPPLAARATTAAVSDEEDDDDVVGVSGFRSDLRLSSTPTSSTASMSSNDGIVAGAVAHKNGLAPGLSRPSGGAAAHARIGHQSLPTSLPSAASSAAPTLHIGPLVSAVLMNLQLSVDLLVTFAQGDAPTKVALGTPALILPLLRLLRPAPYSLLHHPAYAGSVLRALKALKFMSMDPTVVGVLDSAGAIQILVPFLLRESGLQHSGTAGRQGATQATAGAVSALHSKDVQNFVLQTLFYMCRVNKQRQTAAAVAGIVPVLQQVIASSPVLKPLALPILCDLAHAGQKARSLLWQAGAVRSYISLLRVDYWHVSAINALADWVNQPGEAAKLAPELATPSSTAAFVEMFVSSSTYFEAVLPAIVTVCEKCQSLASALTDTPELVKNTLSRLRERDVKASVQRYLLALLKSFWEAAPNKEGFARRWKLLDAVAAVDAAARRDGRVMVEMLSTAFLKDLGGAPALGSASSPGGSS